jgi:hypothetical protein
MQDPQLVMIGDLVGSREMAPARRGAVQRWFTDTLGSLAFRYSGGDEFEVRLPLTVQALRLPWTLRLALSTGAWASQPVAFRCGLGIGPVWIQSEDGPYAEDGPAYHVAREAMNRVRQQLGLGDRRDVAQPWSPVGIAVNSAFGFVERPALDFPATVLSAHLDALLRRWTPEQREVIAMLLQQRDLTSIAGSLSISPSAVSTRLRTSQFDLFLLSMQGLERLVMEPG